MVVAESGDVQFNILCWAASQEMKKKLMKLRYKYFTNCWIPVNTLRWTFVSLPACPTGEKLAAMYADKAAGATEPVVCGSLFRLFPLAVH